MEVRLMLELQAIDVVVARANHTDLRQMEACLKRSEAATTIADFEHWMACFIARSLARRRTSY
jgi:GntR family transcriptional regulator, uxu operon transcriptional repressor